MAFESLANLGAGVSGVGSGFGSITSAFGDIFGSSEEVSQSGSSKTTGKVTEQLELDDAAIEKIISDVLGSAQGLAPIFSEEQVSGLYNTSVAKQEAGDLVANLVGEIAKLTAKKVSEKEEETTSSQTQQTEDGGLIGQIGDLLGF